MSLLACLMILAGKNQGSHLCENETGLDGEDERVHWWIEIWKRRY